jgi:DNA-binding GntR family transcriptional regulator
MARMKDLTLDSRLSDSAYDRIRMMILEGSLAPGTRIVESELAEHIGVSRTPVRSALHRLQQDGYVLALDRGRQTRLVVAPLTKEDAREIYHIVGALDGLVSWHAARLSADDREGLTDRMARINQDLSRVGETGGGHLQRLLELHAAFHAVVFDAIDAPRLKALHATNRPQADRYRRIYSSGDYGQQGPSVEEHGRIVEAIRVGDAEAALCRTQEHWMNAADRLSRIIDVRGEHGNW